MASKQGGSLQSGTKKITDTSYGKYLNDFGVIWQQDHRCVFCLRLGIFLDAFSLHVSVIHSLT